MVNYNTHVVGERIKTCRNARGMSQEELANLLGKSRTNIVNYEAGRTTLPGNVVVDLSDIFNVSTDYLLGLSDNPFSDEDDKELKIIQRARTKMSDKDWNRAMKILKLSFVEAFDDDDDEDEDI